MFVFSLNTYACKSRKKTCKVLSCVYRNDGRSSSRRAITKKEDPSIPCRQALKIDGPTRFFSSSKFTSVKQYFRFTGLLFPEPFF